MAREGKRSPQRSRAFGILLSVWATLRQARARLGCVEVGCKPGTSAPTPGLPDVPDGGGVSQVWGRTGSPLLSCHGVRVHKRHKPVEMGHTHPGTRTGPESSVLQADTTARASREGLLAEIHLMAKKSG